MKDKYFFKLNPSRVWRTYIGGLLLDELTGKENPQDGHYPEEWILSATQAFNAGRENLIEGLSILSDTFPSVSLKELCYIMPEQMLGLEHSKHYGSNPGVLVKLIDAAERLTIQVHPDSSNALRLFSSAFGKTECWHVLGGRSIDGSKPCIFLGFREGIKREYWQRMFKTQNIDGMLECLNKFEVLEGDTYLVNGGVPHAIGAGCLLLEIQEPTDYTLRVERTTSAGLAVPDSMCHQGLGFERMFDCFDYQGYSAREVLLRWKLAPKIIENGSRHICKQLVGYEDTPFFKMEYLEVSSSLAICTSQFSGIYVVQGDGEVYCENQSTRFSKGDQFFIPSHGKEVVIKTNSIVRFFRFYGPKVIS